VSWKYHKLLRQVVATAPFPEEVQHDLALRAGCVAGASLLDDLEGMLKDAGFADIRTQPKDESRTFIREWVPGTNIAERCGFCRQ